jgi:signal transduction histidine kinase
LKDQVAEAGAVGRVALRVLRGEQAESIPTLAVDLNTPQVDWRQLQNWGIRESRVPPGVQIKFRTPSAWGRYKTYIVSALAVLLAQTMLIAGLLVERTRRRQAEAHIRDLGSRLLRAQETERSRIARELHDDLGQQVALLTIQLELLTSSRLPDREMLGTALQRSHAIGRSLHSLSHRVHPASLRLVGLVPALHALQHELLGFKMAIAVTHENVPAGLSPDVTLCLFRVAQEAVQNALKHSGADAVLVHLRGQNDSLALTVTDSGVGFDVDAVAGKGLGLVSMRERLDPMGGTIEIHSEPGRGTRLEIRVPLRLPSFELEPEPIGTV